MGQTIIIINSAVGVPINFHLGRIYFAISHQNPPHISLFHKLRHAVDAAEQNLLHISVVHAEHERAIGLEVGAHRICMCGVDGARGACTPLHDVQPSFVREPSYRQRRARGQIGKVALVTEQMINADAVQSLTIKWRRHITLEKIAR